MKNAPIQPTNESALDKCNLTIGELPKRTNTVRAEVLASLLESNQLTGMESVFKQSTTRLGAVIHILQTRYGWTVERCSVSTGTKDGRIAEISKYWLCKEQIERAFDSGAREWINKVKESRAKQRKEATKCAAIAISRNAARKIDARQLSIFGGM